MYLNVYESYPDRKFVFVIESQFNREYNGVIGVGILSPVDSMEIIAGKIKDKTKRIYAQQVYSNIREGGYDYASCKDPHIPMNIPQFADYLKRNLEYCKYNNKE